VAILSYSVAFVKQWTWISAGIVLSLVPVIALVVIFQKWVVRGLTLGSAKY
jgi:ABC-type glycerol-3-phosphate transport system permease component